jgi:hypothetical protein
MRGAGHPIGQGPEDEIWQAFQIPDRAAILERDRLGMLELPKEIQDQMPKSPSPAEEVIREARTYLIRTSTEQRELCVGNTMARQGVETAIGRLHPVMAVRIARVIEQVATRESLRAYFLHSARPRLVLADSPINSTRRTRMGSPSTSVASADLAPKPHVGSKRLLLAMAYTVSTVPVIALSGITTS